MDIFAHALWTGAAAKIAQIKKPKLNLVWAVFWGIFPDLLAFTLPFIVVFWYLATGQMHWSDFPKPDEQGAMAPAHPIKILGFTHNPLYSLSHSLIIFAGVFLIVWLVYKRPILELLAWLLHILIDIPTHSYKFYPTPFFWPLSNYHINGVSWASPIFMIVNYSALLAVLLFLRKRFTNK